MPGLPMTVAPGCVGRRVPPMTVAPAQGLSPSGANQAPRRAARVVPWPSAVGLALATPVLTWWAIGPLGREYPDDEFRPYQLPLGPLRAVGSPLR